MKIIQPGRPQRGWSREETCTGSGNGGGGCRAVLLVEEPDMYTTRSCDYTGDCETFTTFRCCACGVETDMRNVPSSVQSRLNPKPRP